MFSANCIVEKTFIAFAIVVAMANPLSAEAIPAVDAIFSDLDKTHSPGCALGVIRDGEFVYRRGYGMASLEHGVPVAPDTLFYAGSVSKQFVAAAVALAAEQGHLSLDDDIREHFPEIADYGPRITLRHLVHHTSGLRDYLVLLWLAGKPAEDVLDENEIVKLIARQKALNFPPGSKYLYSNSGYFLLSEAIRRATGQPLRQFAEKNIFRPLRMLDSRFHDDRREIVPRRAFAYAPSEGGGFELSWSSNFDQVGSGGLLTSVHDMLEWERNFLEPRIGSERFLATILRPGEQPSSKEDPDERYAFGLSLGTYRGLERVSHAGAMFGFRSAYLRFPQQRLAVVSLCNVSNADPMGRAFQVADYFLADSLGPPYKKESGAVAVVAGQPTVGSPASATANPGNFAGTFHSDELDTSYEFFVEKGKLVFAGNATIEATPLRSAGPNQFRPAEGETDLVFTFSDDYVVLDAGRVTGIRFDRVE